MIHHQTPFRAKPGKIDRLESVARLRIVPEVTLASFTLPRDPSPCHTILRMRVNHTSHEKSILHQIPPSVPLIHPSMMRSRHSIPTPISMPISARQQPSQLILPILIQLDPIRFHPFSHRHLELVRDESSEKEGIDWIGGIERFDAFEFFGHCRSRTG